MDRLTKPALYAEAGIPCFWRVELDEGPSAFVYRLEADSYVQIDSARPGEDLVLEEPFPVRLDPSELLG